MYSWKMLYAVILYPGKQIVLYVGFFNNIMKNYISINHNEENELCTHHALYAVKYSTVILKRRKKLHQHKTSVWFLLYGDDQRQTH